jgi:UPF0755 protein
MNIWQYSGPDMIFQVKKGDTFSHINYSLHKKGVISSAKLFHRYAQFKNVLTKFKAGNFEIKRGLNMVQVMETLIEGRSITISVTIPEGKNIFEIGKLLAKKNITSYENFIKLAKSQRFTNSLGIQAERIEGYLYPDTYQFSANTPAQNVIQSMVNLFNKKVKEIDFEIDPLTKHEVITLASIVEKETGAKFERPIIAGVFKNRLRKRMRLQSDPTTIYGVYESFNGNLTKKHLREKNEYNTYKIRGLPKGPIANPGIESIKAVLSPENHSYLYFVSQNDGTHIFSKTYKEHNRAVKKFQIDRRYRKGRSWRQLKQ